MKSSKTLWPLLLATTLLAGCHRDGDNDADDETPPAADVHSVHGIAAVGAPIVGAVVALSCKDESTADTMTDASGGWAVDVADAALPCAVKLSGGTVGSVENAAVFYSLASASGDDALTHLTPLTDLVVARALRAAAGETDLDAWFAAAATSLPAVQAALEAAVGELASALAAGGYTVPTPFAPFAAPFAAMAGDGYDDLLEALATALAEDGSLEGYEALRESFAAGGALPETTTGPVVPVSTPLPDDKLGVSFDDQDAAHLWLQPAGQGGVTAINGNGDGKFAVSIGDRTDGGPDGTVVLSFLPNKLGTYACGDAVGGGTVQMQVTFNGITNPRKSYISYQDSFDPDLRTVLPGYSCSVTLTHVGSFESQYVYGDDYVEGTFTAKLRQQSPECAGEGNCSPYQELTVSNGKFRINKSGTYTPPTTPPDAAGDAGLLGALLRDKLAGDYALKCSDSPGQAAKTYAFTINADGSSVFDGAPLVDAGHAGKIEIAGFPSSGITVTFQPTARDSAYVVLGFKADGTFYPNSVHLAGPQAPTQFCYSNSGNTAPAAASQTVAALSGVIGALARSGTLDCTQAGSQAVRSYSINSDGAAQLGGESFAAGLIFNISDSILFGSTKTGSVSYSDTAHGSFRSLALSFDAGLDTTSALLGTGLGPNDSSSCVAQH